MSLLRRLLCALGLRRRGLVFVRLTLSEGPPRVVGPMDRLTAEAYLLYGLPGGLTLDGRRVVSARITGGGDRDF